MKQLMQLAINVTRTSEHDSLSKCLGAELLQCQVSCHEPIGCCHPGLGAGVHDTRGGTSLLACSIDTTAVLPSVAHKWNILSETLDAGGDRAHPLSCTRTCAAAVVPCIAVPWGACRSVIVHRRALHAITSRTLRLEEFSTCKTKPESNQELRSGHRLTALGGAALRGYWVQMDLAGLKPG